MLRAFIEMTLGTWGVVLLDLYVTYSLPINTAVVAYGLLLTLSWSNLYRIRRWLAAAVAHQIRDRPDLNLKTKPKRLLSEVDIPWQDAIQRRFPFVARQTAFWPRRTSVEALQELLTEEELASEALEVLKATKRGRKSSKSKSSSSKSQR